MHLKRSDIKKCIIGILGIILIFLNAWYYIHDFADKVPLYTFSIKNQTMYHPSFFRRGINQDAFMRVFLSDRCVDYAREIRPYSDYGVTDYGEGHGGDFPSAYYSDNNYARYFEEYAGSTKTDTALPCLEHDAMEPYLDDFTDMGQDNDMLRYSFIVNRENLYVSSYFHYAWVYHTMAGGNDWGIYFHGKPFLTLHIQKDGIDSDDELVALWDPQENLYLMTRRYYDENLAGKMNNGE